MLFEPTYALSAEGLELGLEQMFEHEESFAFHEARLSHVSVDTAHLGRSRLCRVRSTGHTISLREPDFFSLLLPRRGRIVVETASETFTARPGDMLVFAPNMRVTHVIPDGDGRFESHCTLIAVGDLSQDLIRRAATLGRCLASADPTRKAHGLRRLLECFFEGGFGASSVLDSERARLATGVLLAEAVGALIEEEIDFASGRSLPSRRDHELVRRAEDIMRERYREALSTREIAEYVGASARRVQIAFLNVRDASPLDALKSIRLERVRDRLLNATGDETVTEIAMECGFFHLGRFSRSYAERFGETPSGSMRRARG